MKYVKYSIIDIFSPTVKARTINYMEDELANFVKFIDLNKNKTTALALIGDHLFMGEPRFIKKIKERHVFNQFYPNNDSKQFRINVDKKMQQMR